MDNFQRLLRLIVVSNLVIALFAVDLSAEGQQCAWRTDRPVRRLGPQVFHSGESERGIGSPTAACCGPPCGYECRSEGLFFNVDIPILTVIQEENSDIASQLIPLQNPGAADIGELHSDFDASIRTAIGWQSDDSWGIRGRYWEFDTFASAAVPADLANANSADLAVHDWHASVFDVEYTYNRMTFNNSDITLSGGYRYLRYGEGGMLLLNTQTLASVDTSYDGHGLTGAAEFRRQVSPRFGVLANARISFVGGRERVTFSDNIVNPLSELRPLDARFVYESQLAVEYIHPICGAGYCFIRGGVEIQYWNEFVAPVRPNGHSNTMLGGALFSVGWQR